VAVQAEQGFAADRLQRPLLRRSCFQRRLKPGVRLQKLHCMRWMRSLA
jgi:hypothetical protein